MSTGIQWCTETWNPTTGCDRVSPGCDRCYALIMAKRLKAMGQAKYQNDGDPRTSGPGFGLTVHPDSLDLPLHWRKPQRIFVNSMSDLFHPKVPTAFIAAVFDVMAQTPQHTYQILTKRAPRMRSLSRGATFGEHWPLPNVWLGVSAENQEEAGRRIPELLDTRASVRFVSAEPLLEAVDLSAWLTPLSPMPPETAPRSWADWAWPDWVPATVREHVEDFWNEDWGRGPRAWMRDMHQQGAPAFGSVVTLPDGFHSGAPRITGRYVHAWNNIGRLVRDCGTFAYTSFGPDDRARSRPLSWVIVGGESGGGARVMEPDWARSIAEQCQDAGVAVFVKQLGAVWARRAQTDDNHGGDWDDWPTDLRVREFPRRLRAAA